MKKFRQRELKFSFSQFQKFKQHINRIKKYSFKLEHKLKSEQTKKTTHRKTQSLLEKEVKKSCKSENKVINILTMYSALNANYHYYTE